MADKTKEPQDRAQTEAEVALLRASLFAGLKEAAQKGREKRGSPKPR